MTLAIRSLAIAFDFVCVLDWKFVIIGDLFILVDWLLRINNDRIRSIIMLDHFCNAVGLHRIQRERIELVEQSLEEFLPSKL